MNEQLDKAKDLEIRRLNKYLPIEAELNRAKNKHPYFPDDMFKQLAIMQEEAGEVTKSVMHLHYENGTLENVREELIQTAAMCMRMLENLDKHIEYIKNTSWCTSKLRCEGSMHCRLSYCEFDNRNDKK